MLAAVALLAFVIGRAGTAVLVTVIVAAAAFELFEGFRRAGFQPATLLALLGSPSMVRHRVQLRRTARSRWSSRWSIVVHAVLVPGQGRARPADGQRRGHHASGSSYVGGLGGFAGLLLAFPDGVGLILGVALCAVAYDVVGYFVGSRMGHRPLMPDVSPNKTSRASSAAWPRRS